MKVEATSFGVLLRSVLFKRLKWREIFFDANLPIATTVKPFAFLRRNSRKRMTRRGEN